MTAMKNSPALRCRKCPVCHQGRMLVIAILPRSPHRKMRRLRIPHDEQDCLRMQIKLRRTSLARPSDRSSVATRFIANIFQGTDVCPPTP